MLIRNIAFAFLLMTALVGAVASELAVRRAKEPVAGPAENFTGRVLIEAPFTAEAPGRASGAMVRFDAGARTAWHTHPLGQSLVITSGCGWVQSEGGDVQVVRPGDVVWIPAQVRHWHGGSATTPMSHLAIVESLDGSRVTWMELVSDEEYQLGESAASQCMDKEKHT